MMTLFCIGRFQIKPYTIICKMLYEEFNIILHYTFPFSFKLLNNFGKVIENVEGFWEYVFFVWVCVCVWKKEKEKEREKPK